MATVKIEVQSIRELLDQVASLHLGQANPSATLAIIGRVMTRLGEPTIGAMLDQMSTLMLRAEERGETIALSGEHWALTAFVDYDAARTLADKGYCTLGGQPQPPQARQPHVWRKVLVGDVPRTLCRVCFRDAADIGSDSECQHGL
jgi:hypothetical protein